MIVEIDFNNKKFEENKTVLRKIRNDIVGSVENKIEYISNNNLFQ